MSVIHHIVRIKLKPGVTRDDPRLRRDPVDWLLCDFEPVAG